MFDVREVLGGSGKVSLECEKAGLKVRNMVDFVTHWNLAWRDHQIELLRQMRAEHARVLWLDPLGASTGLGSAKDRELARFIKEMVQTQLDMGLSVALDATAGGHLWRLPELNALVRHPKQNHKKYSWCYLGAKDPVTQRPWRRIQRVLTNMELDALCRGWQEDVFRPQCCDEAHLRQPTRRRLRRNEDLDRNKVSREYPDGVVAAIVMDIVTLCGQGNEKYDQSFDTKTGAGYGISTLREGGTSASELGRDASAPGVSAVQQG